MKIAILDDDAELRQLWKSYLSLYGIDTVLEASSIGELAESLHSALQPEIILVDIMLGAENSLNSLFIIRRLLPGTRILICTGHHDKDFIFKALGDQVDGYFTKGGDPELLLSAIRSVRQHGAYISPAITKTIIDQFNQAASKGKFTRELERLELDYALVPREVDVLKGLIANKQYKEIAAEHFISINTIRHYVMTLYKKLDISKKSEL